MPDTENQIPEQSVNNIYWIPIDKLTAMACSDGRPIIGNEEGFILVEGKSSEETLRKIRDFPGFGVNYSQLTEEQKKRTSPFRFRDGIVEKVLPCQHRFKNRYGDYTCGRPLHDLPDEPSSDDDSVNMNGLYGMCVLENYDAPDGLDCPYKNRGIFPESE